MSVSDSVGCGWMVSLRSVRVGAHLDRQHAFGDQLAGARTDDADAEDALGLRIEHELRHAVRPVERERPARRAPGESRDRHLRASASRASVSVRPHQASSGSVKTTAGIASGSNAAFSPGNRFDGDASFVRRLVREHRLADDVADGVDARIRRPPRRVHLDEAALCRP